MVDVNAISDRILGACVEVHRHLGPGLLEGAYEKAVARELDAMGVCFVRQPTFDAIYKGVPLDAQYRADFIVEGAVILELKAVEILLPVHQAQVLTYLRLTGLPLGLLVNFNAPTIRGNIKRLSNGAPNLARPV